MTTAERLLRATDAYCPQCGHNRDKSSISSIVHPDGMRSCQFCNATWREFSSIPTASKTPETDAALLAADWIDLISAFLVGALVWVLFFPQAHSADRVDLVRTYHVVDKTGTRLCIVRQTEHGPLKEFVVCFTKGDE